MYNLRVETSVTRAAWHYGRIWRAAGCYFVAEEPLEDEWPSMIVPYSTGASLFIQAAKLVVSS